MREKTLHLEGVGCQQAPAGVVFQGCGVLGNGIQRVGVDDAWRGALGEESADHVVALASETGADGNGVEIFIEDFTQVGHRADYDLWNHGS